jgi:hypothetical protein
MLRANISSCLLLASAMSLGVTGCHRNLQQPASQLAPRAALKEIHVNQKCQILEGHDDGVGSLRTDPAICHLDFVHTSQHFEKTAKDGNNVVTISEWEYLLQNVTAEPVIFVVEQPVPEGWQVDSDPPPAAMAGSTALFRVNAQPGQIVRLHVGEQHAYPGIAPVVRHATDFQVKGWRYTEECQCLVALPLPSRLFV